MNMYDAEGFREALKGRTMETAEKDNPYDFDDEEYNTEIAALKPYENELFKDIVNGLVSKGWREWSDYGDSFALLSKEAGNKWIKVVRLRGSPHDIKICFCNKPVNYRGE